MGRLYSELLGREGYEVEVATGGLECMAKLRRSRPDVLVLAWDLPWGGAAGVLSCLRDEGLPEPGVVLTTCGIADESLHGAFAPPVVYALQKPFPLAALRQGVQFAALRQGRPEIKEAAPRESPPVEKPNASESRQTDGIPLPRRGVLVVDDESRVRALLRVVLEREGFNVWLAAGGEEAVELFRRHHNEIAVALLDVQMPGRNGPETLGMLREIDPQLSCSFMTGAPGSEQMQQWLERSGVPVLAKPFRLETVIEVLRQLAEGQVGPLAAAG